MEDNRDKMSDELIAAFLDGNASASEVESILDAIAQDSETAELLRLVAKVDEASASKRVASLPLSAFAAESVANSCSFDCELFILNHYDFDIDQWSLLEVAKANQWLRDQGTPLHHVGRLLELKGFHVERRYDLSVTDIESALDEGREVIVVLDRNILENGEAGDTPAYHAIYMTWVEGENDIEYLDLDTLQDASIAPDQFRKAWQVSGNYMVTATLGDVAYNPQPISVEDIELDADLEDLTEAIAENAHDIWARARINEGWSYGPVRDDEKRLHPDLVPYAKLPESEKEYDREMAMQTLRLVQRLGYKIKK